MPYEAAGASQPISSPHTNDTVMLYSLKVHQHKGERQHLAGLKPDGAALACVIIGLGPRQRLRAQTLCSCRIEFVCEARHAAAHLAERCIQDSP